MADVTFEGFVAALQRWGWAGSGYEQYQTYLDDVGHTRRLLAAVDDGLMLSSHGVAQAVHLGHMESVGARHFRERQWFDDDARFAPTRFAFVFAYHRAALPHDLSVLGAAAAQFDRMLAVGRADPEMSYLTDYMNQVSSWANKTGDPLVWVPLTVHFEYVRDVMLNRVSWAKDFGGSGPSSDVTAARMGQDAQQVLTAAGRLRGELFRDRWLRAALGEAEWLVVREFAVPVLKELYADVWVEGYAGYYRRLAM